MTQEDRLAAVVVTRPVVGLLYMQVCAVDGTDTEEINRLANSLNPAGTRNGWKIILVGDGPLAPVPCEHGGRTHYFLSC